MQKLEKCMQLLNQIEDEKLLKQINLLLDNLVDMPLDKQTIIIDQITKLIKKEGKNNG